MYVLKSASDPARYYTGVTSDWMMRIRSHNAGENAHTSKWRPWVLDVLVRFSDEDRALAFERYLKSGSGCAFARRHLCAERQYPRGTARMIYKSDSPRNL